MRVRSSPAVFVYAGGETMLDYLWAGMLLLGVVWGLIHGRAAELTQAVLDGGKDAVNLSLTMLGVMSVWTGLMEVGKNAGLLKQINRLLRPVISWLFPKLPREHPAAESISMNFAANMLGLGNAATPAALKAMKELQKLEEERESVGRTLRGARKSERETHGGVRKSAGETHREVGEIPGKTERQDKAARGFAQRDTASNEMCTFLIINISSLQLVPINMIAYRSQYGAVNPASITAPVLIATMISTLAGVIFCKAAARRG